MTTYKFENGLITQCFHTEEEKEKCMADIEKYKGIWEDFEKVLSENCPMAKLGNFHTWVPQIRMVYFKKEFLIFNIDLKKNEIEKIYSGYYANLSDEDKKKSHLSMASLETMAKKLGVKWFRKRKFKNAEDMTEKLNDFYNRIKKMVDENVKDGKMIVNLY